MKYLVSVIIPVYNSEMYLKRCIQSLLKQTYSNCEFIFIDDGSTDNSKRIIFEYQKKYKNIKYFYKKNGGVSSARNLGIKKASGQYLFFLDSDDAIEKNCISHCMSFVDKYDYVYTTRKNEINTLKKKNSNFLYYNDEFVKKIISGKVDGFVCCGFFNADIAKEILFDEKISFMEDIIFLIKYLKNIKTIMNINQKDCNYLYFYNDQSITNSKNVENHILNFMLVLDKINLETGNKYSKKINDKKIILLEKEMRFLDTDDEYRMILEKNEIRNLLKNSNSLFAIILKTNNVFIIKKYYKARKIIKKIYNKMRCV